jgi:pilus assembly protein CpaE
MKPIKITAAVRAEKAAYLEELLRDERITIAAVVAPEEKSLERTGATPADALILYTNVLETSEAEFIERLYMTRKKLCLLLVCNDYDADLMARAMDCGISRVISLSDGEDRLCDSVINAVERERSRKTTEGSVIYDSRVVSVFGTKGGTGKTTLAVNLAAALVKLGKKTAILDLDLQFGDVGIFLDITKADSIADIINENDFKYPTLKSYLYNHRSGLYVLCAPSSPEYAETALPEHIEKIVSSLRSEFDFLVLDLPPVFNECSLTALDLSDSVYFIVNPDISTLKNTKTCFGVMKSLKLDGKIKLALNKDGCSRITKKDIENILEMKVRLIMPYDTKTAVTAINRGAPFTLSMESSKLSKAVKAFAREVASGAA